jgi:transcription elongation factor Elf1
MPLAPPANLPAGFFMRCYNVTMRKPRQNNSTGNIGKPVYQCPACNRQTVHFQSKASQKTTGERIYIYRCAKCGYEHQISDPTAP